METRSDQRPVVPIREAAMGKTIPLPTYSRFRLWAYAHRGFLRAMLLVVAYCAGVISMISMIAFRGIYTVTILTGIIFVGASLAAFFFPGSSNKNFR